MYYHFSLRYNIKLTYWLGLVKIQFQRVFYAFIKVHIYGLRKQYQFPLFLSTDSLYRIIMFIFRSGYSAIRILSTWRYFRIIQWLTYREATLYECYSLATCMALTLRVKCMLTTCQGSCCSLSCLLRFYCIIACARTQGLFMNFIKVALTCL